MKKYLIVFAIFSMSLYSIFSGGRTDQEEFQSELSAKYPEIIDSVAAGEITSDEAKEKLEELRAAYNISYNDESGIIDSFLDQLDEGEISRENALLYFSYLRDERISELRREEGNSSVLNYQRELLDRYNEVISELLSEKISIEEAILKMEDYQRNSGFLRNSLFVKLQTLLVSYQTGALTDSQLSSRFASTRNEWEDTGRPGGAGAATSGNKKEDDLREDDEPASPDVPDHNDGPAPPGVPAPPEEDR